LAWLKEEEEDKKVKVKSDGSLGCVLRKVVGDEQADWNMKESGSRD
jgi:hypothetical protein